MEVSAVEGLMQDYELSLQHVLWRIERLHRKKEIVTKRDEGVHRTTYGEMMPRINRLAGALKRIGVKPGDRVATLAWNTNRHLELYYAVPCMGAVRASPFTVAPAAPPRYPRAFFAFALPGLAMPPSPAGIVTSRRLPPTSTTTL